MGKLRLRATIAAGIVAATTGVACTAAPSALAEAPTQFCAIVGAPAPGPDAASPILGQGCFATRAAETAYVQSTTATAAPNAVSPVSPASSIHLGVAWSGENLTGSRYDFYGSGGTCNSDYYSFANLHGPFDSEANDVLSGANCYDAFWHSGSNFDDRQWDCYTTVSGNNVYQSCGGRMPSGDDGAGHSVRFRS